MQSPKMERDLAELSRRMADVSKAEDRRDRFVFYFVRRYDLPRHAVTVDEEHEEVMGFLGTFNGNSFYWDGHTSQCMINRGTNKKFIGERYVLVVRPIDPTHKKWPDLPKAIRHHYAPKKK